MNVVVLGASGMLGSMVLDILARDHSLRIVATVRSYELREKMATSFGNVGWRLLDAANCTPEEIARVLDNASFAINAIGVTKPLALNDDPTAVARALRVNALFPHLLADAATAAGCHILQIADDRVYSGAQGRYVETDAHDAADAHGKTKSLGEAQSPSMHHLRCSIIGPEPRAHVSLLDWFRRQAAGAAVPGYTNHFWNGITSLHFARLCHGVITGTIALPNLQHIVPTGRLSECELLRCLAWAYRREDLTIDPTAAELAVDRTLATSNEALNRKLWQAAGYSEPPTVPEMVAELAGFDTWSGGS